MRNEVKQEKSSRQNQLRQEMIAEGRNSGDANFDAKVEVEAEQLAEAAEILKKHGRLSNDFTFTGFDSNVQCMKAACELLKSSEKPDVRDQVKLELVLERGLLALMNRNEQPELAQEIRDILGDNSFISAYLAAE